MFKRLRIAFLLYVLLFVAATDYLSNRQLQTWDRTLWVDVYAVAGDDSDATRAYLAKHATPDLAALRQFIAGQGRRYGIHLEPPIAFEPAPALERPLPAAPESALGSLAWSLRMRWYLARLHWGSDRPTPDITVFAVYHDGQQAPTLERSVGVRKGHFTVANLFAAPEMRGSNAVILIHELMHTLGASDKYDPATDLPLYPIGYAQPQAKPLYPQRHAEIMGGRIPESRAKAVIPAELSQVLIGPETALEIGWLEHL